MKKCLIIAVLLSASILAGSDFSQASIVGTSTSGFWSQIPSGDPYVLPFSSFSAAPGFYSERDSSIQVYKPFGNVSFSSSAVGTSLLVDSGTAFLGAVGLLTNGLVDNLSISYELYGSPYTIGAGYEWARLTGPGFNNPDFQGSLIDWMNLTIDSYSSKAISNQQGEPGFETIFEWTITYGNGPAPVPEPATMLLLASGLVGLAGFRRKLKK